MMSPKFPVSETGCTVALLMMPFGITEGPSLGLSLLAQCLRDAGISSKVYYPNLDFLKRIGEDHYNYISQTNQTLVGEWLFSQVMSPVGDTDDFIKFLAAHNQQQTLTSDSRLGQLPEMLRTVLPAVRALIEDWVEHIRLLKPKVVGLSSCYIQHLACLAMAKRLKEVCPEILVVLGGYNCTDVMGSETFRQFPFLDAVVSGPGETVLVELVRLHLAGEKNIVLPGLFWRSPDGSLPADLSPRLAPEPELDSLPIPSFDDFFEVWEDWMGSVWVPIETSRGCWWGQKHHCVFCSENATALRFRRKSPERIYREFVSLLERYPDYGIVANDEILDLKLIDSVMAPLAALPVKKQLHIAIKSNIRKDQLAVLAAAGVVSLLPGIESLDDDVLRPMRKGVSALQNIQLLKWCKEFGFNVVWSILCGFPFEHAEAYRRMTALLPLLTHLPPPAGVYRIRLQRFSPLYEEWKSFGLRDVAPNRSYRFIYDVDESSLNRLAYRFDWDCERTQALDDNTRALRKAVAAWQASAKISALFYYDQNGCLGIGDTRPVAVRRVHKLTGAARLAYLACERAQSLQAITAALSEAGHDLDQEALTGILASLVTDYLMLEEKGLYLGLAHRVGRHSLPPMDIMAELLGASNGA